MLHLLNSYQVVGSSLHVLFVCVYRHLSLQVALSRGLVFNPRWACLDSGACFDYEGQGGPDKALLGLPSTRSASLDWPVLLLTQLRWAGFNSSGPVYSPQPVGPVLILVSLLTTTVGLI